MHEPYGQELILDLHRCDRATFTRNGLTKFMKVLCELVDMELERVHFWDDKGVPDKHKQTNPKTKGTSAVGFILTSTIVVHTLDIPGSVYINIFSCKSFNVKKAAGFCAGWFQGDAVKSTTIERL